MMLSSALSTPPAAAVRPAYSDELGRARAVLEGHAVPPQASLVVAVKELPVERILAAAAWWLVPEEDGAVQLRFYVAGAGAGGLNPELMGSMVEELEVLAAAQNAGSVAADFALAEEHPFYACLSARGYEICQTDRLFAVPGEAVKSRTRKVHARLEARLPESWRLESIRGQDPDKLFGLVAAHDLMSRQAFQQYWNGASRERFEAEYSWAVLADGEVIGLLLVSQRGDEELHIHAEAVSAGHRAQGGLLSASLRQASVSRCGEGFPKVFTCQADAAKHRQVGNSALRQGGQEGAPRHFLRKALR